MRALLASVLVSFIFILSGSTSYAYTTNMNASGVIGQPDFTTTSAGITANKLGGAAGIDSDGIHFVVADRDNNRVLIWNHIPATNSEPADVVVGQADFTHNAPNQGGSVSAQTLSGPIGVRIIKGKLFIADTNRVLIYNHIPTTNNIPADVVIGQADFTSNSINQGGTLNANTLYQPTDIFYDSRSGRLLITDFNNNRVLVYNKIPETNNASADIVIGQVDFTHNAGNVTNAYNAYTPYMIYVDQVTGKLFVTEQTHNRILIYNSVPTSNGASADVVIGQPNFTSNGVNQGGSPAANTLNFPVGGVISDGKRLYIADPLNNRVLIFDGIPAANNASAVQVLGQPNFISNSANQGGSAAANTLNSPRGLLLLNNKLYVAERTNRRVLVFNNQTTSLTNNINISPANTTATISYNTSQATSEYIDYGTSPSYGSTTGLLNNGNNRKTDHTITLTGLQPCTTYHFQVTATDSNLQDQVSSDQSFTTTGTCTGFSGSWKDSNGNDVTFGTLGGDNVFTNDTLPTFSFTQASDSNNGISKYQIIVSSPDKGDMVYLDDIRPTSNTATDIFEDDTRWEQYNTDRHTITVRSKDESHRLTPGAYRWKVRVVNSKGASIDSNSKILRVQTNQAVFSSNSLAFPLTLLQVGNKTNINISTQNILSIPTKPLAITTTTPTFYGITNVGAHVKLILVKHHDTENYDDTYSYTTDANADSRYGINVSPALPTGTYQVTLSATNDSGDFVQLPTVSVIIKSSK